MVSIVGSAVLVNLIFIAFNVLKYLKRRLFMKCTKKPQITQQPVVEAKVVKKKYRLKKKAAAPSKVIDESMYIDDGRYKGVLTK